MKKKILFLDLDGTLLNDRKEITPGNRHAIDKAISFGHRIVVTSGRPLRSALLQAERLGLAGNGCFVIAYNGAVIFDCSNQKEILRCTLDTDALLALFAEANRRNVHIQAYDSDDSVVMEHRNDPDTVRRYCSAVELNFRVTEDIRSDPAAAASAKALMIDSISHETLEDMKRWVLTNLSGRAECFFSSRSYLEVVPHGMSKGSAVSKLCSTLGLTAADAVAVGDEANDVSMIQAAGVGVAMRNAVPEAKAAAAFVTERDNNHDAIAEVIERFLF